MMNKSVLFFSLLSGTALLPGWVFASDIPTHTLTNTPKPEPVSFIDMAHSYKTAAVCFLGYGDCDPNVGFGSAGAGENYSIDTAKQCQNEGFSKPNCNSVQVIDGVCPYNSSYGNGCKCASNLITCPAGQIGVGDSCGGKYASCKCDPKLVSCASNQVGQGASCGGRYQSCACKSEYMYNSSNCKSPRSLSGASCGGKYTGCSCPSGVSAGAYGCKEYYGSPCSSVCKTAYTDNCHKRADNNSAVYGCMKYWSDCSSKCETPYKDNCRNRTATIGSCPANATCTYFSDCSSKISGWSCKSGYKVSGSSCVAVRPSCKIGDIFYTDNTCVAAANHNSSKTVLGIVVYVNPDGVGGQIMAPSPIDKDGNKSSVDTQIKWTTKYGGLYCPFNFYENQTEASKDFKSCYNTNLFTGDCYNTGNSYPAIEAVHQYAPTTETKGKWCLPAAGILTNIYNNKALIQTTIVKVGGVTFPDFNVWSSSSYADYAYAYHDWCTYGICSEGKKNTYSVRPVLEF